MVGPVRGESPSFFSKIIEKIGVKKKGKDVEQPLSAFLAGITKREPSPSASPPRSSVIPGRSRSGSESEKVSDVAAKVGIAPPPLPRDRTGVLEAKLQLPENLRDITALKGSIKKFVDDLAELEGKSGMKTEMNLFGKEVLGLLVGTAQIEGKSDKEIAKVIDGNKNFIDKALGKKGAELLKSCFRDSGVKISGFVAFFENQEK